jgi:hypothetical protein
MDHEAAAEVIMAIVSKVTGKLELPDGLDASHRKDIAVSFDVETAVRLSLAQGGAEGCRTRPPSSVPSVSMARRCALNSTVTFGAARSASPS